VPRVHAPLCALTWVSCPTLLARFSREGGAIRQ
jgi:hypothetical protein